MSAHENTHRIILLNFSHRDAQTIAKAGYNVERGFSGVGNLDMKSLPYHTPHPIYEYDILFYNSAISDEMQREFTNLSNGFVDRGFRDSLSSFNTPPRVRVSFIGDYSGLDFLFQGGVPRVGLLDADENVSALQEVRSRNPWHIHELHDALANMKSQVSSVGAFYTSDNTDGFWNVPVLVTRDNHWVMGYATTYSEPRLPKYIILPRMHNTGRAVIEILRCLEELVPALFPGKRKVDWIETDEFLLPEELVINNEIALKIQEAEAFIEAKQSEKSAVSEKNSYVRRLLTAREDPALPLDQRLSGVVKGALEFLEFAVENIDEKVKNAIKREDFWVSDENFLAITEVTGTVHKNPKVKEFNDILGRMMTLYKRQSELVLPDEKDICGLLVLNYDIENHPSNRPRPYTGMDAHIAETGVEQKIGILSTVELHKIVMAVKRGSLSKADARELIKTPGRIEFAPTEGQ